MIYAIIGIFKAKRYKYHSKMHLKNRCARAKPGLQTASCGASAASLIPITARPQFDRHGAAEAHLFFLMNGLTSVL